MCLNQPDLGIRRHQKPSSSSATQAKKGASAPNPDGGRRSVTDKGLVELLAGSEDAFVVETLLPACSFTSLSCATSEDSSRCLFYWVDLERGLLGRGTITSLQLATSSDVAEAAPRVPKLGFSPERRASGVASGPHSTHELEVLLRGLNRPSRVAVGSGKVSGNRESRRLAPLI